MLTSIIGFQVVLDEIRHCQPLVLEIDDIVLDQLWRLGLTHLIATPSMEIPHGMEAG